MNKTARYIISIVVSILCVVLTIIANNHVRNYKNIKEAEYVRKVNNVVIDALAEINKFELNQRITDSLKYEYWANLRPIKERQLRFYPINENGKKKIIRQIVAYKYPEFSDNIIEETPFMYDDYIPTFVAGKNIIERIVEDLHLYTFFDTIESHMAIKPVFKDYELDTIHNIIKKHFILNDIDTNFEYCIYVPAFNKFILSNKDNIIDVITHGDMYNFEIYNANVALFAFFIIRFTDKPDYLSISDDFVIIFTWIIVLLIYILFIYLLYTDRKITEVSELRNEFVNNITHEFKTPIATIALASEALLDSDIAASKDAQKNYVEIIQTENKRLENMVTTILESALISKKSFLLRQKKNNVDANYCIEPAIREVLMLLEKKNGTIEVNYSAKNGIAYIDGSQIIQVIKNILENAIKYVSDSPPHIEIKTENKGKYIVISIKDNGIGMTQAQQKKVFKKLYRASTGDIHNVKGYGLGLYNAHAIIKSHHGKITVESEPNKGSTFRVYLPTL